MKKKKLLPHVVFVFGHPLFLISKMRKGNKERKKSLILAGKIKSKKMRGMKMRIITCFGDRTISRG